MSCTTEDATEVSPSTDAYVEPTTEHEALEPEVNETRDGLAHDGSHQSSVSN